MGEKKPILKQNCTRRHNSVCKISLVRQEAFEREKSQCKKRNRREKNTFYRQCQCERNSIITQKELQQLNYLNNKCNQNLPKAELISGLKALEGENVIITQINLHKMVSQSVVPQSA